MSVLIALKAFSNVCLLDDYVSYVNGHNSNSMLGFAEANDLDIVSRCGNGQFLRDGSLRDDDTVFRVRDKPSAKVSTTEMLLLLTRDHLGPSVASKTTTDCPSIPSFSFSSFRKFRSAASVAAAHGPTLISKPFSISCAD